MLLQCYCRLLCVIVLSAPLPRPRVASAVELHKLRPSAVEPLRLRPSAVKAVEPPSCDNQRLNRSIHHDVYDLIAVDAIFCTLAMHASCSEEYAWESALFCQLRSILLMGISSGLFWPVVVQAFDSGFSGCFVSMHDVFLVASSSVASSLVHTSRTHWFVVSNSKDVSLHGPCIVDHVLVYRSI